MLQGNMEEEVRIERWTLFILDVIPIGHKNKFYNTVQNTDSTGLIKPPVTFHDIQYLFSHKRKISQRKVSNQHYLIQPYFIVNRRGEKQQQQNQTVSWETSVTQLFETDCPGHTHKHKNKTVTQLQIVTL